MTYTETDKIKALAIVSIFETSRPLSDFAACVVLNDGAGISYGICQFTHRSGALAAVVERYLQNGGKIGTAVLSGALLQLSRTTRSAIDLTANDAAVKTALKAAAASSEMRDAQLTVAFDRYLKPAADICVKRGFMSALSLAVVYDSIVHGSFEKIAALADKLSSNAAEKMWITTYVRRRHAWLGSIKRLSSTTYRTKFFLGQIAVSNWDLKMPVAVNGYRLTGDIISALTTLPAAARPNSDQPRSQAASAQPQQPAEIALPETRPPADIIHAADEAFERVESAVNGIASRTDRAKSLWATIAGTLWQTIWAAIGLIAGVPREIWIVAAVIVAVLTVIYLYRQHVLGRIRESSAAQQGEK